MVPGLCLPRTQPTNLTPTVPSPAWGTEYFPGTVGPVYKHQLGREILMHIPKLFLCSETHFSISGSIFRVLKQERAELVP